jgi:hypothetical protein
MTTTITLVLALLASDRRLASVATRMRGPYGFVLVLLGRGSACCQVCPSGN